MICSTAFVAMGGAQAAALGHPELPIAVVPHPFGLRSREEIRQIAVQCADDIARLLCDAGPGAGAPARSALTRRAATIAVPGDLDSMLRLFHERRWSDGLPVVPPTPERVALMLQHTRRAPDEVIATLAPAFGMATVERIAINAVMAGCYPEHLPVLIAAAEAVAAPEFNLQGIQATTGPVAVWLIVNGPIARRLDMNSGGNCLGPGAPANAALGRALHLILQNIGGGLAGDLDRATQGQPGKFTFCCAENEAENPWQPLHVERGFAADCSTVTVAGAAGTTNINCHAKDAGDLLRVIADTMTIPAGSDYTFGGAPWLVLAPEHAHILRRDGLAKADVKRRLWEQARLATSRLSARDFARVQDGRRAELGELKPDTRLTISVTPDDINFIVAGGPGTHSVYIPGMGHVKAVSRAVAE